MKKAEKILRNINTEGTTCIEIIDFYFKTLQNNEISFISNLCNYNREIFKLL
jgi:hypothetical protein